MCAALDGAPAQQEGNPLRHATKIVAVVGAACPARSRLRQAGRHEGQHHAAGKKLTACMVLDTGGVDDHSFNQSSWAGMQEANKANSNIKISYVAVELAERLRAQPDQRDQQGLRHRDRRRWPDGRRRRQGREGEPRPAVRRDRRRVVGATTCTGCSTTPRRAASSAATSPPAMTQDRQGRDLRWPEHPAGHDLHGRLLGGRAVLQQAEGQERPGARLGRERSRRRGTFANSFTDQNKGKQITQAVRPAGCGHHLPGRRWHRPRCGRCRAGLRRQGRVMWVDTDGCESAAQYCKYFLTSVDKSLTKSVDGVRQRRPPTARSRRAATSARWRTAAPASRRSTTSTARSRQTSRASSTRSRRTSSPARSRSPRPASPSDADRHTGSTTEARALDSLQRGSIGRRCSPAALRLG